MRPLPMRLTLVAALFRDAPELSSLAILDTALLTCEAALLAANPELLETREDALAHHDSSGKPARALIMQVRKLSIALAAYRQAVMHHLEEERARAPP